MVNNSQLQKIVSVIKNKYICPNQNVVEEIGMSNGKRFHMKREVCCSRNVEYTLMRFDPNDETLFPYFDEIEGLHKICDYILFAENNDSIYVFLIELKKDNGSPLKQLDISESFVHFIIERAKYINEEVTKEVHIRKVGVKDTTSTKMVTNCFRKISYDQNRYLLMQSNFTKLHLDFLIDAPIKE